jgi:transcriptional regulator with XRE-family HTH domain
MRAHAAADDEDGRAEGRPIDAGPADRQPDFVAAPAQPVNPLQRLIAGRLQERGLSYGEVARRSGLPRSTIYTLATTQNLVRPPRPATINGLAKGLDLPVSAVRAAAAESTGLHYYDEPRSDLRPVGSGDHERELLIASIDELSPEDRRHVAALVESLRNRPAPPAPLQLFIGNGCPPSSGRTGRAAPMESKVPRLHRSASGLLTKRVFGCTGSQTATSTSPSFSVTG